MKILKDHKKAFSKYWGYSDQDIPICWSCYKGYAVDIHHIENKKMGGSPGNKKNSIDNLIPLCRKCHDFAHKDKLFNQSLKDILKQRIDNKEFEENEDGY